MFAKSAVVKICNATLAAWLSFGLFSLPAQAAQPPIALIITVSRYVSPLLWKQEPQTDGLEFKARLLAAGFTEDRIKYLPDATRDEMAAFVADAATRYADAAAFVVFYSGHGILYGSEARLLPRDFSLVSLTDAVGGRSIEEQTIPISGLLRIAGNGDQPALFVFDACRDDLAGAGGKFFATLYAADVSRAGARGDPAGSKLRDERPGTFDNQGEYGIRDDESEKIHRDNAMILFGGVRTKRFGPGISYGSTVYKTADGAALSELTGALIAHYDRTPDDGVEELFVRAKDDVFNHTGDRNPRQVPLIDSTVYGNVKLSTFAHPPNLETVAAAAPQRPLLQSYAGALVDAQELALSGTLSQILTSPFKLKGFTPNTILGTIAPNSRRTPLAETIVPLPPEPERRPTIEASLAARIWQPDDRRVLGAAGQPEIRLPSPRTARRTRPDGAVEFSQRIQASPGFRIVSSKTTPLTAAGLLEYRTDRENDADGALAEVKSWRLATDGTGRTTGAFSARLTVTEQRPRASFTRSLTGTFAFKADQHAALALTPDEIANLDAIEIRAADGKLLAELHRGDRNVPVGLLRAALQATPAGIVLQIASP